MKILHTVAPAEFGGLEEVVIRLASGLRGRGHEVSVACVLTGEARPHPFTDALASEGVDCIPVFVPPRTYRREMTEVRKICETLRPDVVHTHGYRCDVLHRKALKRSGIPLVTTLHGFTGGGRKNRLYEWLQIRSASRFDGVVAVSRPMAALLRDRGVPDSSLHVIPNAWGARRPLKPAEKARAALGVATDRFHVGWVGRLSREKGPDTFLQALALLNDVEMDVSIVGDGPLRSELEQAAEGVTGPDVRFHGAVPDAGRLFSAFDLVVLSSRTEGTPIVLFEAMAASVPVIATAVGGIPDVVDAESALLVPSDDPPGLADAIRSVVLGRVEAGERAERAAAVVHDRFATGPWLARYEALYADVIEKEPGGGRGPGTGTPHQTPREMPHETPREVTQ